MLDSARLFAWSVIAFVVATVTSLLGAPGLWWLVLGAVLVYAARLNGFTFTEESSETVDDEWKFWEAVSDWN